MADYPGKDLENIIGDPPTNIFSKNNKAKNVLASFLSWPQNGMRNAVNEEPFIPDDIYNSANNHFQGIHRSRDGIHFLVSGGSNKDKTSHLFIKKLNHFLPHGNMDPDILEKVKRNPIGSNVMMTSSPPDDDILEEIIKIESNEYWHAGGIGLSGDVLSVPLESDEGSKIIFIHCEDVLNPQKFPHEVMRPKRKAGASSMIQLVNEHFLLAVWTDSDNHSYRFDFYLSESKSPDGPYHIFKTVRYRDIPGIPSGRYPKFQSINFVEQIDGTLFIIGLSNTSQLPNLGDDKAYLISVELSPLTLSDQLPVLETPVLRMLANRSFKSDGDYYKMNASCGIYISSQNELILYSGAFWRKNKIFRFAEFSPQIPISKPKIEHAAESVIELYSKEKYKGRCMKIIGKRSANIQNYTRVDVNGDNFENAVSSIRIQIPIGSTYIFYKKSNYQSPMLTVSGNGLVQRYPTLGNNNLSVSSSRFVS